MDEFVEVGEGVRGRLAVLEGDRELVGFGVDGGDGAAAAVEDARPSAMRVVADLLDAVAEVEGAPVVEVLGLVWRGRMWRRS